MLRSWQHCTLTAKASVAAGEAVPDFTVVYGNGQRRTDRRDIAELKEKAMLREIEVLRRLIPSNPAKFQ